MARRAQSSPDHAGNCDRPRQSDRGQSNLGRPAAARAQGVPAGFVAFEEDPETIKANLAGFTWAAGAGAFDKIQFIDGRGPLQAAMTGSFDPSGLLTQLSELIRRQAPGWIVLDGLDNLLDLLPAFAEYARDRYWVASHLAQFLGVALLGVALLALACVMEPGAPAA